MARPAESVGIAEVLLDFEKGLQQTAITPGLAAYKPHASQEKFHRSTAKEKLYIGGNRSGKTVGGGAEVVQWLTGEHRYRTDLPKPPVRGRMVAVDIEDGIKKIAIPEIKKWMPTKYLKDGSWDKSYDKQSRTLTLTNGSFLEFMSYEQEVEKFAGTSRHFTWFDEEPPEDIFNECILRLVDTDGSYWITMTPLIEMSWTKDRIYDPWLGGDRSIYVLEVNTTDNPHIKVEALDRLTRGLSESEREARRSGRYISHTGLVYSKNSFNPESASEGGNVMEDLLTDIDLWKQMQQFDHFVMMDHGLFNPTVFLFACYNTDGAIIVYDEIYIRDNIIRDSCRAYLRRREQLGVPIRYIVGDPAIRNRAANTGLSYQSEYAEHGVYIALGNNDVSMGIARVQNRFAKKLLYITRRCEKTLWEISNYRWDRFQSSKIASRRNAKDMPMKKNDHAMDALRYGVCSSPAMDDEVDMQWENVLNAPVALSEEFDWHKMYPTDTSSPAYDDQLGSEW